MILCSSSNYIIIVQIINNYNKIKALKVYSCWNIILSLALVAYQIYIYIYKIYVYINNI